MILTRPPLSGALGSHAAAFTPPSIANCELYLEADTQPVVADGTNASAWTDQSGNGRTATPSGGNPPKYYNNQLNGLPALDMTAQWFDFASNFMSGFTAADVFFLYKAVAGNVNVLHNWSSNADAYQPYSSNLFYEDFGSTTRRDAITTLVDPATQFRLYEVAASAGQYDIRQDGNSMFSAASNTVGFAIPGGTPHLGHSNSQYSTGATRLIASGLYSRILTLTERNQLRDYYNTKYGLSIS